MDKAAWELVYERMAPALQSLEKEAKFALERAIGQEKIKLHSLTGRVKTIASLREKAQRKGYDEPLSQAADLVGVRVVVLFMADLARIEKIVESEFEVLESDDKVDGGNDPSTFGYMSRHFDVRIPTTHSGPRYSEIRGIDFEVQVRTLLMDAWANVSHVLAYKGEESIPVELRRDFHALSGLFYVADKHFELFFGRTLKLSAEAGQQLGHDPGGVDLNLDTLGAFLRQRFPERDHSERGAVAELADELLHFGYSTIADVEELIDGAQEAFEEHEEESPPWGEEGRRFMDVGVVRCSLSIVNEAYEKYLVKKVESRGVFEDDEAESDEDE